MQGFELLSRRRSKAWALVGLAVLAPAAVAVAAPYSSGVVALVAYDDVGRPVRMASAFLVREDGLLASTYHAVRDAKRVDIHTQGGDVYPVLGMVAFDPVRDFAILKLGASGELHALPLGDSDAVKKGARVRTITGVVGFDHFVAPGVVKGHRLAGEHAVLDLTATVALGASGGPVLDTSGRAIGIALEVDERYYFLEEGSDDRQRRVAAVPINAIKASLEGERQICREFAP